MIGRIWRGIVCDDYEERPKRFKKTCLPWCQLRKWNQKKHLFLRCSKLHWQWDTNILKKQQNYIQRTVPSLFLHHFVLQHLASFFTSLTFSFWRRESYSYNFHFLSSPLKPPGSFEACFPPSKKLECFWSLDFLFVLVAEKEGEKSSVFSTAPFSEKLTLFLG